MNKRQKKKDRSFTIGYKELKKLINKSKQAKVFDFMITVSLEQLDEITAANDQITELKNRVEQLEDSNRFLKRLAGCEDHVNCSGGGNAIAEIPKCLNCGMELKGNETHIC